MGLDITAYRHLNPISADEAAGLNLEADFNYLRYFSPLKSAMGWSESQWPGRAEGLDLDTVYEFFGRIDFSAGGYSSHGEFRSWLARLAGFRDQGDFWDRATPGSPFYELICFADNEGVIGPKVSEKLADDFARYAGAAYADVGARATEDAEALEWLRERYALWWGAFITARRRGAVSFH